nr:MAG TPA: hypothetical protein [Caudoviricetes sp.]
MLLYVFMRLFRKQGGKKDGSFDDVYGYGNDKIKALTL